MGKERLGPHVQPSMVSEHPDWIHDTGDLILRIQVEETGILLTEALTITLARSILIGEVSFGPVSGYQVKSRNSIEFVIQVLLVLRRN